MDEKVAKQVKALKLGQVLPNDSESVRKSPIYDVTLQSLQWQRDNYLMGQKYADRRKVEREKRPHRVYLPKIKQVPYDPQALGNVQLAQIGSSFIVSPTVKNALMPIVLSLPRGSMYPPTLRAMTDFIDTQQSNLDGLVKQQVLWLLEEERVRSSLMNSTKGYLADTTTRDRQKIPS